jgi:hypothetical protein
MTVLRAAYPLRTVESPSATPLDIRDADNKKVGTSHAIAQANADRAIVEAIDRLREEEGASVTILCDDPDFNGKPDGAVIVCGSWTAWEDRRFDAPTVTEALRAAVKAMDDSRGSLLGLKGAL